MTILNKFVRGSIYSACIAVISCYRIDTLPPTPNSASASEAYEPSTIDCHVGLAGVKSALSVTLNSFNALSPGNKAECESMYSLKLALQNVDAVLSDSEYWYNTGRVTLPAIVVPDELCKSSFEGAESSGAYTLVRELAANSIAPYASNVSDRRMQLLINGLDEYVKSVVRTGSRLSYSEGFKVEGTTLVYAEN